MDGEGDRRAPAAAASVAAVLGGDDLLREILLRLGFPHYLVRAALVSKRWLLHASDPALLRRFFGDRDPPRLLGFCVCHPHGTCEFVALPQPPELAALPRRAASSCDDAFAARRRRGHRQWIRDCRNGRLLIECVDQGRFEYSILTPLLSGEHVAVPPPAPPFFRMFLTEDGRRDGVTMVRFYDEGYPGRQVRAKVSVLGSGGWGVTISTAMIEIKPPYPAPKFQKVLPPVHGNIFMVTNLGYALVLDLKTPCPRFFILDLPDVVEPNGSGCNFLLSCAENSGVYLVSAQQFQISVWLHRMTGNNGDGAGGWLLVDTFCVREACARLDRWVPQNGGFVEVLAVGDNADFVFLEHRATGAVFYVHLRSKVVQKVYQRVLDGHVPVHGIHISSIMMIWPPIFPARDVGHGQQE